MLAQTWIFVISGHFLLFLSHHWPRKLKFGKNVRKHLEILSLYTHVPLIKIICTLDMMYGSWDMKFNRQNYFVILAHVLPLTTRKMKISNMKKTLEISSFYTSLPRIMIIRYTVPEMWRETDVIVIFILGYTFPFYSPNSPKNENFKTMKKKPGDIIILHKGIKNHDQMLCYSWDIACVVCNCYWVFLAIVSPFTPLTAQKMKAYKKWKNHLEISSFNTNVPNIMIICYIAPEIWHMPDVIVIFHLGLFLPFYSPNNTKKLTSQ